MAAEPFIIFITDMNSRSCASPIAWIQPMSSIDAQPKMSVLEYKWR